MATVVFSPVCEVTEISPRNGGIRSKCATSVRNFPISTSGFSPVCRRLKSFRIRAFAVEDGGIRLLGRADPRRQGCSSFIARNAVEACAQSIEPGLPGAGIANDSRPSSDALVDAPVGITSRGPAAASPGCTFSGSGCAGTTFAAISPGETTELGAVDVGSVSSPFNEAGPKDAGKGDSCVSLDQRQFNAAKILTGSSIVQNCDARR